MPLVCMATGCMALAATGFLVLPPGTPLWPLGILFGVGYGAYSSVDWALAVDVLPLAENAGKDMGIWSTASTFPTLLAPLVGAIVLNLSGQAHQTTLGYQLVFLLAALCMIAGAVLSSRCAMSNQQTCASQSLPQTPAQRPGHPAVASIPCAPWWRLVFSSRSGQRVASCASGRLGMVTARVMPPHHAIPNAPYHLFEVQFTRRRQTDHAARRHAASGGNLIAILHVNNRFLTRLAAETTPWQQLRMMRDDLRALAQWVAAGGFPKDIHALYGHTLLGRSAPRLGFTIRERPSSIRTRLDRFFLMGSRALPPRRTRAAPARNHLRHRASGNLDVAG